MTEDVLLQGFGFSGFRSFSGPEIQQIGPMSKVHLVAGPNNVGKSNILAVAQRILPHAGQSQLPELSEADTPLGEDSRETPFRLTLTRRFTEEDEGLLESAFPRNPTVVPGLLRLLQETSDESGLLWIEASTSGDPGTGATFGVSFAHAAAVLDLWRGNRRYGEGVLANFSRAIDNALYDDATRNAQKVLERVRQHLMSPPPVATVSAFRRIGPGTDDPLEDGHDGPGLIDRLLELQSPSTFDAREAERRYVGINQFVATLFDDPSAFIRAANDRSTIFLHRGDRRLPLENIGTGVHEVIILAAAATVLSKHLVCIEEPEIHLHPTLQRKLLTYLHEKTDNQYLIATHSAHLLDTGRASISAVSLRDGRTQVAEVVEPRDVATLSAELGLRASDLVQANAIVWVEGPSDRTYLRRWLQLVDDGLVEGEHFSIMFYGGSLLSELSPEDPSIEEFVSLPRINRNFSIVIDSDRHGAEDEINATKQRVSTEFEKEAVRGIVWVTAGYTIENYVPADLLKAAVEQVHSRSTFVDGAAGQFENPLGKARFVDRESDADKGAVAGEVVARWDEDTEWLLDLKQKVMDLAAALRKANDLPPTAYGFKS